MNFSEYLRRLFYLKNSKLVWLLSLLLVVALFLAACGGDDKETKDDTTTDTDDKDATTEETEVAADEEQVLNLIMTAEIPTMDSALVTDAVGFDLLNNVNEGLYRLNQENIAVPAISDGEPTVSEDGLVYTFTIT